MGCGERGFLKMRKHRPFSYLPFTIYGNEDQRYKRLSAPIRRRILLEKTKNSIRKDEEFY
jgi:hypothetical protein